MRRPTLFIVPLSAAVLLVTAASWQKKDFSQWTADDAKKVLGDSPWAKQVSISGGTAGAEQGGAPASSAPSQSPAPSAGGGSRAGGGSAPMGSPSGGGARGGGMAPSSEPSAAAPQTRVLIVWVSATPVRLAELKSKAGEGQPSQGDVEQAKKPADSYQIALIGVPGQPQSGEENQLAAAATLNPKGKEPIKASSVKEQPESGGNSRVLIFTFPKTEPITLDDKSVEFRLAKGPLPTDVKENFKLKDMQFGGKLEL